jgi:hypothetical protein
MPTMANEEAQVVDPGVFPHGGDDAGGEPEHEGNGEGEQAEFERDGQLVRDDFVDGAVGVFERRPEVAVRQAAEVVEVLPVERLVQSVVRLEVTEDFGRHGLLRRERTARHETDHEERGRDDHEQDGNRLQQAAGDEAKHRKEVSVNVRAKGRGDEETFPGAIMAGGPPEPLRSTRATTVNRYTRINDSPAATRSCRTASTTHLPASRGRPDSAKNSSR